MADAPAKSALLFRLNLLLVWVFVVVIAAGLVVWHRFYGMMLFSGMDGGVLINAAWQECHGAVAYRDFLTAAPPLFLLPAGWAFSFLGPTWMSLLWLTSAFSVLTFLWTFLLLRHATAANWNSLFFAAVLQGVTMLLFSWWWYNEITNVIAALFLCSAYSLALTPANRFSQASFLASEAILGLLKVNVAGLLIPLIFVWLIGRRDTRVPTLVLTASAILVDVVFLAFNHITVPMLLGNYLAASAGRMTPYMCAFFATHPDIDGTDTQLCLSIVLILFLLAAIFGLSIPRRWRWSLVFLLIAAVLVAAVSSLTGYSAKLENFACLIILIPLVFRPDVPWSGLKACLATLSGVIVCYFVFFALSLGESRLYFRTFGRDSFPFHQQIAIFDESEPPLFRGMRSSLPLAAILLDIRAALQEHHVTPDSHLKIFFGPSIDYAYAAYNLPVYPGLPLWWEKIPSTHRGDRYPIDRVYPAFWSNPAYWIKDGDPLDPRVQHFLDAKFDLCIFQRDFPSRPVMTFMPGDLRAYIYENYTRTDYRAIVVFARKQGPKSPAAR